MAEREVVLKRFGAGDIEVLVAVRCLDEGVDVPATETAYFLASTSNPRQFVQRRGRVLRKSQGKTRAIIVDFLVVPSDAPPGGDGVALSLLRREMPRFAEFSLAATNVNAARKVVFNLLDRYGALNMLDETPWDLYEQVLSEQSALEVSSDPIFLGE
jgi:superfamily II DNA/RNA helicase